MKLTRALLLFGGLSILSGTIYPSYAAEAISHDGGANTPAEATPNAENAIKLMKFDAGLKVSLFAAEPMFGNPVCFATDEKGRWYIGESYRQESGIEDNRGHMDWLDEDLAARTVEDRLAMIHKYYPDANAFKNHFTRFDDRITRVEDSNGDGKADIATVIAEGFNGPLDGTGAGILVRGNDIWYTCIPDLWHLKLGPDGKVILREKLLTGFGVHYAFRGHDLHGLCFGPDGKLYFSIGDRGIHVVTKEKTTISSQDTGSIMRCNPDGTDFEVFATGVRNPQELTFDEHGNLFTGDNNSDAGDLARFQYLVEGGDGGWRTGYQYLPDRGPWMSEKPWDATEALKSKYINPPVANIGNGPSGLTYNPGTGLSAKYQGRFYMSDFRGGPGASLVHEILLEPQGATFKVKEHREFVRGVLTTDVEFGIDGSFYVLDWVESWGGVKKGRIYQFTDPASDTAVQARTKQLIEEGMAKRPEGELAALFSEPDQRVRQAAQFELVERDPAKAIPLLKQIAQSAPSPLGRLHGIWGLGQLAGKHPASLAVLPSLLADADAEVRAQAAHILGDHKAAASKVAEKLIPLLKDTSGRVRYFAALGLGKLDCKAAFEPLCAMLAENNDQDPILRQGGVMGLYLSTSPTQLAAKKADPSAAVRVAAVLALRLQKSPLIADFLADQDPRVVLEAARAIHDVPIDGAMPALGELIARKGLEDPFILKRAVNARYRSGGAADARALAAFATEASAPEAQRILALEVLADWAHPGQRDRLLNVFRPLPDRSPADAAAAAATVLPLLLKEAPVGIQVSAAKLAAKLGITSAGDALYALALNDKAGAEARVEAIRALASLKDPRLAETASVALSSKEPAVRLEGVEALVAVDPHAAVKAVGVILEKGGVLEKQTAIATLILVKRPEANVLLADWMKRLIAHTVPAEIQVDLLEAARKAKTPELDALLKQYKESLPKDDDLAPYRIALVGGNIARGRAVFHEKIESQCLRCHRCEEGSIQIGPDLTHIGATKDREYLLESIVLPNKRIAEGYETAILTLKDGSVVAGRLVKEENGKLQIEALDEKGNLQLTTIDASQIKERTRAPSPMPETTRDVLSKPELRDLVEYLATRK